jgi:uncharacterized membrane protein
MSNQELHPGSPEQPLVPVQTFSPEQNPAPATTPQLASPLLPFSSLHSSEAGKSLMEKEFELERVMLFSDAVFAIAITLLVIDIKFPDLPENLAGVKLLHYFRPTIFGLLAFIISFFFIGRSWSIHLQLFRMLKTYDQGLINRNLFFLFFIATFPFTASGVAGHLRTGFTLPFHFYVFNITLVMVSHLFICRYILFGKTKLAIEGYEAEKKYMYIRSLYSAISMVAIFVMAVLITVFFPYNENLITYLAISMSAIIIFASRKAKKYKPVKAPD